MILIKNNFLATLLLGVFAGCLAPNQPPGAAEFCLTDWNRFSQDSVKICFKLDSTFQLAEPEKPTWDDAIKYLSANDSISYIVVSYYGIVEHFPNEKEVKEIGEKTYRERSDLKKVLQVERPKIKENDKGMFVWVTMTCLDERESIVWCFLKECNAAMKIRITSYDLKTAPDKTLHQILNSLNCDPI